MPWDAFSATARYVDKGELGNAPWISTNGAAWGNLVGAFRCSILRSRHAKKGRGGLALDSSPGPPTLKLRVSCVFALVFGIAQRRPTAYLQGMVAVHEAVHDAVAMAIQDCPCVTDGQHVYRVERVALLLTDGSVWQVESVQVPVEETSISLRAAAWWCKQDRASHGRRSAWRMIRPPRPVSKV